MKIEKDNNNLLTIFNENIPQTKEYTYHVGGYMFSDFDKWIIVLHKKQWKIISLKNLGDTMSVVYIKENSNRQNIVFCKQGFLSSLSIFWWFDEKQWREYAFFPWISEEHINMTNKFLEETNIWIKLVKTTEWVTTEQINNNKLEDNKDNELSFILSYLLGLISLYGKFDNKKWFVNSYKIQIPLFWKYLAYESEIDNYIKIMAKNGFFMKVDKLTNKNGIVYQISSNDYEVLEIFAQWYEPVEKFEKITKREFTQEMKISLIEFIKTNTEIPQEGKDDVLKQITEWTIKLLTK